MKEQTEFADFLVVLAPQKSLFNFSNYEQPNSKIGTSRSCKRKVKDMQSGLLLKVFKAKI